MSSSNSSDLRRPRISLAVVERDEGSVELELRALGEEFCVGGSAYFNTNDVNNFTSELRQFPLSRDPSPFLTGGYFDHGGNAIVTETFHISVSQISKTGLLVMMVRVFRPHFKFYEDGFGHGGRCSYFLNYEALTKFTDDLEGLIAGKYSSFEFGGFTEI